MSGGASGAHARALTDLKDARGRLAFVAENLPALLNEGCYSVDNIEMTLWGIVKTLDKALKGVRR